MKYSKTLEEKISIKDTMGTKFKDKFNKLLIKLVKGFRYSKDAVKFPKGVDIDMRIDVEKDFYDQVVVDNKSGQIIHEDHEKLSEHNFRKPNKI